MAEQRQYVVQWGRLKIGDEFRVAGDPVPEAAEWKTLGAYLSSGQIKVVEGTDESSAKKDGAPTLAEMRKVAKNLGMKGYSKMKKGELAAAITVAQNESPPDPETDPETPDPVNAESTAVTDFTTKELRAMAKDAGIKGRTKMSHDELATALMENAKPSNEDESSEVDEAVSNPEA